MAFVQLKKIVFKNLELKLFAITLTGMGGTPLNSYLVKEEINGIPGSTSASYPKPTMLILALLIIFSSF